MDKIELIEELSDAVEDLQLELASIAELLYDNELERACDELECQVGTIESIKNRVEQIKDNTV